MEGFIYRPAQPKQEKYPVIIYNRGGTGDFGKITSLDLVDFCLASKEGFVIVASNYRYVVIYAEGGHSLPDLRQDRNRRIIQWFRRYQL